MDKTLRVQVLLGAVDKLTRPMRDALGGTRSLSAGLKETQDRLKALKDAQRDVGRFRELKAGLRETSAELAEARTKAGALAAQMNATSAPTRRMTADFRRARDAVNALEQKEQEHSRELQTVRARMAEAGAAGRTLASHERDLRDAIGRTNAELGERRSRLDQVAGQQRRMANAREGFDRSQQVAGNFASAGAGMVAGGAALVAPIALANRAAGDYESTLTDVAQKANLNRTEATALGRELAGVGQAANQLPSEVVAATDALTGLGAGLGEARDMIPSIARGATAYRASMEDLGRASYAAVDTLQIPAAQTAKVLDVMAEAGKRGAFEVRDMAQYFPSLTAAAAGLEQTGVPAVADLAAALQITRKGAGDSAEAATNLGNLLQKVSSPLTVKNFAKFGIDLERELAAAARRGETPIEAIANLTNRALDGDMSKLGYLFEDAQVQKALRPLIANMDEYRSIRAAALAAEGVVNADFAERMKDQNEATKAAGISVRALGLAIGAQLAPTVTKVAGLISGAAIAVTSWAQKNPELAGTLAKIVAVIGILLVVAGGLALAVAAVLGPLAMANMAFVGALPILTRFAQFLGLARGALMLAGRAVLFLGRALLMNPIGLAITAIAIAAFLIIKYWKPITGFFKRVWSAIQDAAGGAMAWFRSLPGFFSGLWNRALAVFRAAAPMLLAVASSLALGPVGLIIRHWSTIAGFFGRLWSRTVALFREAAPMLLAAATAMAAGPVGVIVRHWSTITGFFASLWARVRTATSAAVAWFGGLGARFRQFGADMISGLIQGLTGRLGQLRSTITGVAGQAANWFRARLGIHSPSRVFAGFGQDTMDGLNIGLERGQSGPLETVRNAAAALAAVMAAQAAPVMAAPVLETPAAISASSASPVLARLESVLAARQVPPPVTVAPGREASAALPIPAPAAPMAFGSLAGLASQAIAPALSRLEGLFAARQAPAAPSASPGPGGPLLGALRALAGDRMTQLVQEGPAQLVRQATGAAPVVDTLRAALPRLAEAFQVGRQASPVASVGSRSPAETPGRAPAPMAPAAPVTIHIHPPAGADADAIARAVRIELEKVRQADAARNRSGFRDQSDT